ncbi:MAG: hypothetical protein FWH18_00585 [Marinilabiliaceae bacterium]|nr:hypothetical protein [Marinilabiliaceae bacterium]
MNQIVDRQNILRGIDELGYKDKLFLLSYIAKNLQKSGFKTHHQLTELKGLGKEIWQKCDVENYVQNERASWD